MRFAVAALLLTTLAPGTAAAVPRPHTTRLDRAAPAPIATQAGLVCNERGCWRPIRRFSWYRPYGYYRPYRGDPRAALGDWNFGIGRYGAGTYYDADPYY